MKLKVKGEIKAKPSTTCFSCTCPPKKRNAFKSSWFSVQFWPLCCFFHLFNKFHEQQLHRSETERRPQSNEFNDFGQQRPTSSHITGQLAKSIRFQCHSELVILCTSTALQFDSIIIDFLALN